MKRQNTIPMALLLSIAITENALAATTATTCISPTVRLVYRSTGNSHTATELTHDGQNLLGRPDGEVDFRRKSLKFYDRNATPVFFKEYVIENPNLPGQKFFVLKDMRGLKEVLEEGTCSTMADKLPPSVPFSEVHSRELRATHQICDGPFRSLGEVSQIRAVAEGVMADLKKQCSDLGGKLDDRDRLLESKLPTNGSITLCVAMTASAYCNL